MSVSLYRWTEACEGRPCPGDCDLCAWEPEVDSGIIYAVNSDGTYSKIARADNITLTECKDDDAVCISLQPKEVTVEFTLTKRIAYEIRQFFKFMFDPISKKRS